MASQGFQSSTEEQSAPTPALLTRARRRRLLGASEGALAAQVGLSRAHGEKRSALPRGCPRRLPPPGASWQGGKKMPRTRIPAPLCCCRSLGRGATRHVLCPTWEEQPRLHAVAAGGSSSCRFRPSQVPPAMEGSATEATLSDPQPRSCRDTGSVDVPVTRGHVDDTHPAHKDTSGDVRLPTCGQRTPWPQACVLRHAVMSAL